MSKVLLIGMAGYLMGMKHDWLCGHICWAKLWRRARRMLR